MNVILKPGDPCPCCGSPIKTSDMADGGQGAERGAIMSRLVLTLSVDHAASGKTIGIKEGCQ